MKVTHPVLRRILKRIKLSEGEIPTLEQWHALLKIMDSNIHEADQAQYLNELSINVSSREMAEKNKELTNNIDTLKMLQQKLIQSEKMATIGQLSAGIAHEINNPLGFSLANIGSLEKRLRTLINLIGLINNLSNDSTNKVTADLISEITHFIHKNKIHEIITDLNPLLNETKDGLLRIKKIVANLSRFADKKMEEMKLLNINDCIESAVDICRNELNEKCELTVNLGTLPQTSGVFADLEFLFINMLLNAKQSIRDHGKITISSKGDADNAIISITDNGCGIDPENINKIYNPFFSTRQVGSGVGLGLTVAYGIVELHRGKIHVESQLNQGSVFTIILPVTNDLGIK
jgi:two-component system NtrC family sensor kinase